MLYRGTPAGKVAEHTALEGSCSRWMLWRCPKELGEWSSWHHGGSPYRSQQISHLSHCFGKVSVKRDVSREISFDSWYEGRVHGGRIVWLGLITPWWFRKQTWRRKQSRLDIEACPAEPCPVALQPPQTALVEDQVSKHRSLVRTSHNQTLYHPKRNLTSKESQGYNLGQSLPWLNKLPGLWGRSATHSLGPFLDFSCSLWTRDQLSASMSAQPSQTAHK